MHGITFELSPHTVRPGVSVVQVFHDGKLICTITPAERDRGFNVVSKFDVVCLPYVPARPGTPSYTVVHVGDKLP